MGYRSRPVVPLLISGVVLAACGSAPASTAPGSVSSAACTSPIASKAWYMQSASVGYEDPQNHLSISFTTYNLFKSLGSVEKGNANFEVPGGSYAFPPDIEQTAPGVFSLSFSGTGQFSGSNFGRAATVDLKGTVDENTGAADLTLKAEGSIFHLVVPVTDTSGAVALSKRIAADIGSKNWSDVYQVLSPNLRNTGTSQADLARDMNAIYRHVSSACRLGPGQYVPAQVPLQVLGDRFTDVLAISVTQDAGPPVPTFATVDLKRQSGTWVFVSGNPPGESSGSATPSDSGIPAPSP